MLLQRLARQAAAWWRTQLASSGYAGKFSNGDTSRAGETAQIMASMVALQQPEPAQDALNHFEQLLFQALWERMESDPSPTPRTYAHGAESGLTQAEAAEASRRAASHPACHLVLSVDYGPEGELRKAAESARVSGFPWKTTMWVNWDADPTKCYIDVRYGYGAEVQRLPTTAEQPAK